jgi:hypothetical protein
MWEKHEQFNHFPFDASQVKGKASTMQQLKEKLTHVSESLVG